MGGGLFAGFDNFSCLLLSNSSNNNSPVNLRFNLEQIVINVPFVFSHLWVIGNDQKKVETSSPCGNPILRPKKA